MIVRFLTYAVFLLLGIGVFILKLRASELPPQVEYTCTMKPEKGYFDQWWLIGLEKNQGRLFVMNTVLRKWVDKSYRKEDLFMADFLITGDYTISGAMRGGKLKVINNKINIQTVIKKNRFYTLIGRIKHSGKFHEFAGKLKFKGHHRKYRVVEAETVLVNCKNCVRKDMKEYIKGKKVLEEEIKLDLTCLPAAP